MKASAPTAAPSRKAPGTPGTLHPPTSGTQPVAAAIGVDAIVHSIPGINVLLSLLAEPAGAAAGVAYMMSLVRQPPRGDGSCL